MGYGDVCVVGGAVRTLSAVEEESLLYSPRDVRHVSQEEDRLLTCQPNWASVAGEDSESAWEDGEIDCLLLKWLAAIIPGADTSWTRSRHWSHLRPRVLTDCTLAACAPRKRGPALTDANHPAVLVDCVNKAYFIVIT